MDGLPIRSKEKATDFTHQLSDIQYQWKYRVTEPDGRVISVEKYFESEDFKERYQKFLSKQVYNYVEIPVYVGTLKKPFGISGYTLAEVGHPVFEFEGKYRITIYNEKTKEPHFVSFYKETLEPQINK
jgi:hypothetical protein